MSEKIQLLFQKLYPTSQLPMRKNPEDAGYDCFVHHFVEYHKSNGLANTIQTPFYILKPQNIVACALGFATAIPNGYYAHLLPRSGLALKEGIMTVIGTIDSGYRNEWNAIVYNMGIEGVKIEIGERICQFILRKMEDIEIKEVNELPISIRGLNGFGSSGKK